MQTGPGNLTASRITTWPGGIVAEVVLNERTEAFARWLGDSTWSEWWFDQRKASRTSRCAPTPASRNPWRW